MDIPLLMFDYLCTNCVFVTANTCPDGCSCNGLLYVCDGVMWTSSKADLVPNNIRQL